VAIDVCLLFNAPVVFSSTYFRFLFAKLFFCFYYGDARMINRAPLYTKKLFSNIFTGFWAVKLQVFLYKTKKVKRSDHRHQGESSVAGVAGVAAATGVVEATLGAAVVAAARAASRAVARAAADEAGLSAVNAVAAVASGAVLPPGTSILG
jgi:hypothetical protein